MCDCCVGRQYFDPPRGIGRLLEEAGDLGTAHTRNCACDSTHSLLSDLMYVAPFASRVISQLDVVSKSHHEPPSSPNQPLK